MNMNKIHPDFRFESFETGLQELLRNVFMKINFIPGVRHVIGWRGLKDSSTEFDCWTAKVRGVNGIYGISFSGAAMKGDFYSAEFSLFYFPHPDEDLVENFSIPAGLCVFDENYFEKVREFMQHEDLIALFNIGKMSIIVNSEKNMLFLLQEALSESKIIADEGLNIIKDGEEIRVLDEGEIDQNLPAWDILYPFFEVIASSFTFILEESPSALFEKKVKAYAKSYDSNRMIKTFESDDIKDRSLLLVFGDNVSSGDVEPLFSKDGDSRIEWTSGDDIPGEYAEALWWNSHRISDFGTLDKNILGIDERPHFIVVTGFLGSGKTSFLQNFIEYQVQRNLFVAVIQNEIGEIGLDSKLLEQDYAVTEMDEGCVCCTLVGNLKSAISEILSEFTPDYIVLETTGVANPANLISEICELEEKVRFDSVTVIVDSLNLEKTLAEYEVAREQLRTADILLLNKEDLVDEQRKEELVEIVREYNPDAPVVFTKQGDINPSLIYDPDSFERKDDEKKDSHDHHGHHHHDHHHHSHHFDSLSSIKVDLNEPVEKDNFFRKIDSLPSKVFRIKGIVEFKDEGPMLFQYVAGRYDVSEYSISHTQERFLIFIGQNMEDVFSPEEFVKDFYS